MAKWRVCDAKIPYSLEMRSSIFQIKFLILAQVHPPSDTHFYCGPTFFMGINSGAVRHVPARVTDNQQQIGMNNATAVLIITSQLIIIDGCGG